MTSKLVALITALALTGTGAYVATDVIPDVDRGSAETSLISIGERAEQLALFNGTDLVTQLDTVLAETHQRNGEPLNVTSTGSVVQLVSADGVCFAMTLGEVFEPRKISLC